MMMIEDAKCACQLVPIFCDICLALSPLISIRGSNGGEGLGFNPLTTFLRLALGGVIVAVGLRFLAALQWSGLVKVSGWKLILLRFALVTMISLAKAGNLDNVTSCGFMCLHFLSSSSALELHLVSTLKGYRLCPGWFDGLPKMRKRLYSDNPFREVGFSMQKPSSFRYFPLFSQFMKAWETLLRGLGAYDFHGHFQVDATNLWCITI